MEITMCFLLDEDLAWCLVLVVMETKRTDFDNIRQDVNKIKKYASDLQTFIGVNEMTSVLDAEVKKQKGAFNYDLFELKLDFPLASV
jgi:hypothetical protein